MFFAKRVVDARCADEVYRGLSEKDKARRLRIASAAVDHPESTCPNCRYDLSGIFSDDDPPQPCPECGELVSPANAVMAWCRDPKGYNRNACIAAFSGLFQAVLALVYSFLVNVFGGSSAVQELFMSLWIAGFTLNAIVLPFILWKMQRATSPNRHPAVAVIVSIVGAFGSLATTFIFFCCLGGVVV